MPRFPALVLTLAVAAALGTHAGPGHGASADEFGAAFAQYQEAMQGKSDAIAPSATRWRELSDAAPTDPVLRAYAGSATTMLATTTMLPWRKMGHAEDGLALLDKALAQLTPAHDAPSHQGIPASLSTRFVAASTFIALPAMFNRKERGERLLQEVLTSPLLAATHPDFRATVWMTAARHAQKEKRTDEARQWLQKVAEGGSKHAASAAQRLKEL